MKKHTDSENAIDGTWKRDEDLKNKEADVEKVFSLEYADYQNSFNNFIKL